MKNLIKNRWLPFEEAHKIVLKEAKERDITIVRKWKEYSKLYRPYNVPAQPSRIYKEWKGWKHWLGTENNSNFLPFEEAQKVVRGKSFKNSKEYRYFISNNDTLRLPYHPNRAYVNQWVSWWDWLGTKRGERNKRKFLPFEEAHKIILKEAKKWGIDSQKKWYQYCVSGNKPDNIPRTVHDVYSGMGWESYGHWLGTGNVRGAQRKYNVNHNFFKEWSRDMAYVLGFWFADGCICHQYSSGYRFRLCQHKKDEYLLKNIASAMGASQYPLHKVHDDYFELSINSKTIYDDIIYLGGIERKSADALFPFVPHKYTSDFIRGYFDGDGCIYKHGKSYLSNFVCGSFDFINELDKVLKKELNKFNLNVGLNIKYGGHIVIVPGKEKQIKGKMSFFRENYRLNLSVNDTRNLRDFMYNNVDEIRMKRKYEKFMMAGELRQIGGRVRGAKNKVKL